MSRFSYVDDRLRNKGSINGKLSARDLANTKIHEMNGTNDHGKNLQRLFMERGDMFGIDSKNDIDVDSMGRPRLKNNRQPDRFGEIIENDYDEDINLRGLPVRSQYNTRKQVHDANANLDFDLYDDRPSKLNVGFNDLAGEGNAAYCGINESMSKLSSQVHPISISAEKIDRINNNIFYYLFDIMKSSTYMVNGIGLFNLFASLYLASDGITEVDTQKFFSFPRKDILHEGMMVINKRLNVCQEMINIKNFMFVGDVPYNQRFYNTIKPFCMLVTLNIDDPENEALKVNMMIKKMFNVNIKNPLTTENVQDLQLMFLTTAVIHPIWAQPWDEIIPGVFQGFAEDKKVNYMRAIQKSFGYFEDDNHQLVEIKCHGDELVMGFLNYKHEFIPDVNDSDLHAMIQHMKNSMLSEVVIPGFHQDLKIRLNNTLKNMGMQSVFLKITAQKMFPEGCVLQDVVQNIKILVDDSHRTSKNTYGGYKTNVRVVLNKPFIFYFRLVKTNTILLIGAYQ
jgi:serine protease inhibitor